MDDFHFVKLVEAIEATDLLPPRSCFTAKAWGIACRFDGERLFGDYLLLVEVHEGDFSCGEEVELLLMEVVHHVVFIGELPSAKGGSFVDEEGKTVLGVTCLVGFS